jgi:hypothetical protein
MIGVMPRAIGEMFKPTVTATYKQNGFEQRLAAESQHNVNGKQMTFVHPLQNSLKPLQIMAAMSWICSMIVVYDL